MFKLDDITKKDDNRSYRKLTIGLFGSGKTD